MEIICLDTDVLIAHKRAKTAAKPQTLLYRLASQSYRFAVSVITTYEWLRGDNQNEDQYWKTMFDNMQILPFDYDCSEPAANLYKTLKQQGLLIETEDLLSAATASRYHLGSDAMWVIRKKHLVPTRQRGNAVPTRQRRGVNVPTLARGNEGYHPHCITTVI